MKQRITDASLESAKKDTGKPACPFLLLLRPVIKTYISLHQETAQLLITTWLHQEWNSYESACHRLGTDHRFIPYCPDNIPGREYGNGNLCQLGSLHHGDGTGHVNGDRLACENNNTRAINIDYGTAEGTGTTPIEISQFHPRHSGQVAYCLRLALLPLLKGGTDKNNSTVMLNSQHKRKQQIVKNWRKEWQK